MEPSELERHVQEMIHALREDARELERRLDVRRAESQEHLAAQILINTGRLTALETWQNQVLGASKAGRLFWTGVLGLVTGAFALYTWLYEHFFRGR